MSGRSGRFAILEQLRADGVRYIFGNPGTVEQGFLDALGGYPDLRYILTLQETIAVAIADGYARATRQPGVVQLHSGVGIGNGIGMIYQAMRGHAPLVVIAGEAGLRYSAFDAQMASDLVELTKPVTKYSTRAVDPGSVLRVLRRAIKIAMTPPTGPVFISLPMDVLDAPNHEPVVPTSLLSTRVIPAPAAVARAVDLLGNAEHPMLIIGDGVHFSSAQPELARVAELLGAEVWGADSSEVNLSATHPLFMGQLGHMFGSHSLPITARADAVLICGTYVFPEVFPALSGVFAPGARVVHVDLNPYEIAKNFPVDLGLVADPKLTLGAIADALQSAQTPDRRESARVRMTRISADNERARLAACDQDQSRRDESPLRFSRFASALAEQVPDDVVIFDEALTSSPALTRYLPPVRPGHYFQTRGGSLGVGIPGAIGLKLAYPDKTVVGFTGDGGSMYTIQALWSAVHHRIGAKFVICNNQSYALLKDNLLQYWRERDIPEHDYPDSFDLADPDIRFADLARAVGVPGLRVETPDQVAPAIKQALTYDGPFLLDVVIGDHARSTNTTCKCGQ